MDKETRAALIAKARRTSKWNGFVYAETYYQGKGCVFESVYEFQYFIYEEASMDPFLEKPDFIWAAKEAPSIRLVADDLFYLATWPLKRRIAKGLTELKAAITSAVEAFNTANARVVFHPDYSIIIPLQWDEPVIKKAQRLPEPAAGDESS